jgi:hypothetical protein
MSESKKLIYFETDKILFENACLVGNLPEVKRLLPLQKGIYTSGMLNAIKLKQMNIIDYLLEVKDAELDNNYGICLQYALHFGHEDIVKKIIYSLNIDSTSLLRIGARYNRIDIIKRALYMRIGHDVYFGIDIAIKHDNIEAAEYLINVGDDISEHLEYFYDTCCNSGNLDMFKMINKYCGFDQIALKIAIKKRNLKIIKYLLKKNNFEKNVLNKEFLSFTPRTNCDLPIIKLLIEYGCDSYIDLSPSMMIKILERGMDFKIILKEYRYYTIIEDMYECRNKELYDTLKTIIPKEIINLIISYQLF